jgi:hypothetical protein
VSYSSTPITDGTTNLIFTPVVDYSGGDVNYNPIGTSLASGDPASMEDLNSDGVGEIFLWVGGSINVTSSTPAALYEGTFQMTVAY